MIVYIKSKNIESNGFGLIGILIVVAVIALVSGGGLYLREVKNQKAIEQIGIEKIKETEALKQKIEQQKKQAQEILNNEKQAPQAEKSSTVAIDTSDWKTYRNEEYGFEIAYPQRYKLTQLTTDHGSYSLIITLINKLYKNWPSNGEGPPSISLVVHSNTNNLTVLEWAKINVAYSNFGGNHDVRLISGSQAISYSWEGLGFGRTTVISKDAYIYILDTLFYNQDDKIMTDYDQILSTFKFIR